MSIQRSMRRHIKRQKKAEPRPEKPIGRVGKAVNWAFAKLPAGVRRRVVLLKYTLTKPAPHPSQIGKVDPRYYRPVLLELPFRIHADGKIDYINRWGGDIRMADPKIVAMVQNEYNCLVQEAKRQGAL